MWYIYWTYKKFILQRASHLFLMFDRAFNVQLGFQLLIYQYPKLRVMRGVECTVSLFSNSVAKIPIFTKSLNLTNKCTTFLVVIFIIIPIPLSSKNHINFTILTFVSSVVMTLECLDILLECTYTCTSVFEK